MSDLRLLYRDTDEIRADRAIAVVRYRDFAHVHQEMNDALQPEVRQWLEENIPGELEWDVWDRDMLSQQSEIKVDPGRWLDNYYFIFQFTNPTEAAMFALRWPVVQTRPILG